MTLKEIRKTIGKTLVNFAGYDDKEYCASVTDIRRGLIGITYSVPGRGEIKAYISDKSRLSLTRLEYVGNGMYTSRPIGN